MITFVRLALLYDGVFSLIDHYGYVIDVVSTVLLSQHRPVSLLVTDQLTGGNHNLALTPSKRQA
jgi:hypothetical protein